VSKAWRQKKCGNKKFSVVGAWRKRVQRQHEGLLRGRQGAWPRSPHFKPSATLQLPGLSPLSPLVPGKLSINSLCFCVACDSSRNVFVILPHSALQ
jgi:hypothetical protein